MKSMLCLTVCAFSLLAFASTAQSGGAEANGDFTFGIEGATGTVVFDSVIRGNDNSVHGQMSFTATLDVGTEVCLGESEDTCLPEPTGDTAPTSVALTAQFDCMLVTPNGNRAAMSGVITSPTDSPLFGKQTILVVEQNVEGISPSTDAFAWGVYKPKFVNLTATDYDFCPAYTAPSPEECGEEGCPPPPACNVDSGASLAWITADAERYPCTLPEGYPDVAPVCPVPDPHGSSEGISVTPALTSCDSFPPGAYPLNLIPHGGGNKVNIMLTS